MASLTPALPTFVDRDWVTTRQLNTIPTHVGHLYGQHNAGIRATKPMCVVARAAAESNALAHNTTYWVDWSVTEHDTETPVMFDPASTGYVTVRTPGIWLIDLQITATCSGTPAAGSLAAARIAVNGLDAQRDVVGNTTSSCRSGADGIKTRCAVPLPLDEGTAVRALFWQNSGGSAVLSSTAGSTRMSMEWLAPLTPIGA